MLCLTCHQPRCENLPLLRDRTFSATLINTLPPTLPHRARAQRSQGRWRQTKPCEASSRRRRTSSASCRTSQRHVFFLSCLFSSRFVSFRSLPPLGRCAAHLFRPLFILPLLPLIPLAPAASRVHARGASHPQCLIPPCGSSLPAAAAAAAARCSGTLLRHASPL